MPSSEWKKQSTGERWYPGETISVAIGQGQNAVTPMGLGGDDVDARQRRQAPRAAARQGGRRRIGLAGSAARRRTRIKPFLFKPETMQAIHDGLWLAVNGAGTAGRARIAGRDVAGKTGTAQVISLQGRERARGTDKDLRDHGWFVFMVPRDNPELAGVVFAEHSEHGYLAAPIAKHVIETYYAEKEGRPLPTLKLPTPPGAPATPTRPANAVAGAGGARRTVAAGPTSSEAPASNWQLTAET